MNALARRITMAWLVMVAVVMGIRYRIAFRFRPTATLNESVGALGRRRADPVRLSSAVSASARVIPGYTCLPQAYAMRRLMRSRGHDCEVRFGVATAGPTGFSAHAWVEDADGNVVHGATEEDYTALVPAR